MRTIPKIDCASDKARFYVLLFFLTCVFLMGGGSRGDIQSLALLRPISIFVAAYAFLVRTPGDFRQIGWPFFLLVGLGALILVQLIPLPPGLWTALPGRNDYIEMGRLVGIEQPWRSVSLSPARSVNSLFALSVPFAAMMIYAVQGPAYRGKVIPAMMAFVALSALLAIFQISSPGTSSLYLYRVTNEGLPVGLFANRNHQAVTMAAMIVLGAWYFSALRPHTRYAGMKALFALGQVAIAIPLIFVAGSRAGLLLGGAALALSMYFILRAEFLTTGAARLGPLRITKKLVVGVFSAMVAGLILLVLFFSRTFALDRFLNKNNLVNQRSEITPYLIDMARDYFPFGSGFGTFAELFKKYESIELLGPTYLNQAHNDWIQIAIESGIAGAAIVLVFMGWMIHMAWSVLKAAPSRSRDRRVLALSIILIFALASVVDYPLRTPIVMTLFSIFCVVLARKPQPSRSTFPAA